LSVLAAFYKNMLQNFPELHTLKNKLWQEESKNNFVWDWIYFMQICMQICKILTFEETRMLA
jgi:hemoglobin-like flavoprotein